MTVLKGLTAINNRLNEEAINDSTLDETIALYTKEMTELGVPGAWHYQMFADKGEDEDDFPMLFVVLFDPDNESMGFIGMDETPYKAWMDAEWTVDEGGYPFNWEELSESTKQHTQAWGELEVSHGKSKSD